MKENIKGIVISKDVKIFADINRALLKEDISGCEFAEDVVTGLDFVRQILPDIVFLDEELCLPNLTEKVGRFMQASPRTRILFIAHLGKRDKINTALAAGAAGYILKPIEGLEVTKLVQQVLSSIPVALVNQKKGKTITLFSTVDSVGKTTIAVNLAAALSMLSGEKVCIVDADLQFGDVCRMLNLSPSHTIADFARQRCLENDRIGKYLQEWEHNIDVLASPEHFEQVEIVTSDVMTESIQQLCTTYSYLIIDTSVGFTEVALSAIDLSDWVLFINTLGCISCVKNLKRGMDTLKGLGYSSNKVKLVLNRSKAKTAISVTEVETAIGSPFVSKLCNDFSTAAASVNSRIPFVLDKPDKEISRDVVRLAKELIAGTLGDSPMKPKLTAWLNRWLDDRSPLERRR